MAATLSGTGTKPDATKLAFALLALDNSYPTGGYAIDFTSIGIRDVQFIVVENTSGYDFAWDRVNKKLQAYQFNYPGAAAGPGTEVPNATDLSAISALGLIVVGQ